MKNIFIILIIFLISVFFPSQCRAKSYTIDEANIDITINKDGSANISEMRDYTFSGHFENGWWSTGLKKSCTNTKCDNLIIKNVQVYEGGTPINSTSSRENGLFIVKWKYTADNESKSFTVTYRIENAINNYLDTAEFYWQLIQDGWSVSTDNFLATIHLPYPSQGNEIKAWGHGPLSGKVSITNSQTIVFSAKNIPANTFVEGRVVFPKLTSIPVENENALERIQNEEASWINETISKAKTNTNISKNEILVLICLAIIFFSRIINRFIIWKKMGKDLPLPEINLSGSLHEPPYSTEPALVESILSRTYSPSTKSITATVLDLCRKKQLKISQENRKPLLGIFPRDPEIWFELKVKQNEKLTQNESDVVKMLYLDENEKISKSSIFNKTRGDFLAKTRYESWKSQFENILLNEGYLDSKSHEEKNKMTKEITLTIVFSAIIFSILRNIPGIKNGGSFIVPGFFALTVIYIICIVLFNQYMNRLTLKGAQEKASWIAFKKYLSDYSVTKNSPLESVIIWEKYLVYGAALGVSLKALSELPVNFGSEANNSFLYGAAINNSSQKFDFSTIGKGLDSVSSSFTSYGASGSGSSGGFSGGGGGGGGMS